MVDVPKYTDLLFPTVEALRALGGSGNIQEIFDTIVAQQGYDPEILEVLASDGRNSMLIYRCAWARTDLKFVEVVTNSERGVWALTDLGKEISEQDLRKIITDFRREYNRRRKEQSLESRDATLDENDDENDEIEEENWTDTLLSVLKDIESSAFERLAQRLLRESDFIEVKVTGQPGDDGIDGSGILRMNLITFQVMFQCKRYAGSVGSGVVRDFRGAMQGRADKGLIITTGFFTSKARKEATRDGAPSIDLVDGEALCHLLKEKKLGVSTELVEKVKIDEAWFEKI